ncbi:hypothetical protein P691DRAFT_28366 [Macrolepiota fuliginosa MF-IS2]|uniref:F-box domain-containing protein n=1 Tax=Macrolepiota fuliginosa MF-IS2 TaxID=1400762 RepID=A0A9P5XCA7_9AGAR|nr:hypothetical protein P691DRAFT_28366 [Macrolepiota fuliginosa MF-IS2]
MTTASTLRCVPAEIEDLVIAAASRMARPSKDLLTCALVCKSWVPASRRNLLVDGVVTIRPKVEYVQSLLDVLQSPYCTIRPHITTLSIAGKGNRDSWNATWQALPQILSLIPFSGLRLQDPLMDGSLMDCGGHPPWTTIKQVQLLGVWRSDYTGLLVFLSSLPALEELVVRGCWERPYIPPNTLIRTFPLSFKKLDVDSHAAEDVC